MVYDDRKPLLRGGDGGPRSIDVGTCHISVVEAASYFYGLCHVRNPRDKHRVHHMIEYDIDRYTQLMLDLTDPDWNRGTISA